MILVFGGTTEGRLAIKTLDEGSGHYFYSTRGEGRQVECGHGIHVTGGMDGTAMEDFCLVHGIRLIVDAAHPFARTLHATVASVAARLGIPVVRLERRYPDVAGDDVVWCAGYADAVCRMKKDGTERLLALTGVQTIAALHHFWKDHDTYFRILNREESLALAAEAGFPESRLVYYGEDDLDSLLEKICPDAVITKESGVSGGFPAKIEAARRHGVRVYVVRRPPLPESFITVDGEYGLRREVERVLPDFYTLHIGFTTGSCATAAAKAALWALLTGEILKEVSFRIPEGETMRMDVEGVEVLPGNATASVIKDAGDDPDVTHRSRISVTVAYAAGIGIRFYGGEGIGTVTLPGLGLDPGEPAINPVPRRMISSELSALYQGGLEVTVSLEDGEQLAARTFNPRVGIVGGVSIIGTTGIVRPFSHEAFVESIRREIGVAVALRCHRIVVNSGGKSEKFMRSLYPDLPQQAFIHYGNAVADTMEVARECGVKRLTIGLMLGKAVKLAQGHMDTHSHKVSLDKDFLKEVADDCGCSADAREAIEGLNLARELPDILSSEDAPRFFNAIVSMCRRHCAAIYPGALEAVLIADNGRILSRSEK